MNIAGTLMLTAGGVVLGNLAWRAYQRTERASAARTTVARGVGYAAAWNTTPDATGGVPNEYGGLTLPAFYVL